MLKRELKVNLKNFIIWNSILVFFLLVVYLIYPTIATSENLQMLEEMMKMFPKEVLKAFNMDISSLESAFGWLKSEGFVFVLLIIGLYSGMLGANILVKEESDKTIEYLNSLPMTRTTIVLNKVLCSLIYIASFVLFIGLFNFIGLLCSGPFDMKAYFLLSITPLFSSLVSFAFCLFLSTFVSKNKKALGISLGIVFGSYFLLILSQMSQEAEFLKYFSLFFLADVRNVITNVTINPWTVIISIALTGLFIYLAIVKYNRKDLV